MLFPLWLNAALQFICLFLASIVVMGDVVPHPWDKVTASFVSALQAAMGLYGHTRDEDGHALVGDPDGKG